MKPCILIIGICLLSCQPKSIKKEFTESDKKGIVDSVSLTLNQYFADIEKMGLTAEFSYLDTSKDFFWVPPGFTQPLTYDSVKASIQHNATLFSSVKNKWQSLKVYPLTPEIATYTGIIECSLTDTGSHISQATLIETGTVIKRSNGWKLLCGQTAIIK